MRSDPVLRPLYPQGELAAAEERLCLFLMQYWGGPRTYDEHRGHPRLRLRHAAFAIGPAQRDAWLSNMREALDEAGLEPQHEAAVWEHLERAAHMLLNSPGDPPAESGSRRG